MILINSNLQRFSLSDESKINRQEMGRVALNLSIADTAEIATIDIDGVIGDEGFWSDKEASEQNTAVNIRKAIRDLTASKVVVNINSLGGYADEGLAILDALKESGKQIETRVYGMTASAATIIAQAGSPRVMSKNALYLVHNAWTFAIGNRLSLQKTIEDLAVIDDLIANVYADNSGKDKDTFTELMSRRDGEGVWLKAEEALEYGLIDEIASPEAKPKNNVSAPVLETQQNEAKAAKQARQLQILKLKGKRYHE